MPDWGAWVESGAVGVPATELSSVNGAHINHNWDTRSGKRGLDNQGLFANFDSPSVLQMTLHQHASGVGIGSLGSGLSYHTSIANEIRRDGHSPLSPHGHAVQPQEDSSLLRGQNAILVHIIVNEDAALHSEIGKGVATIHEGAITISDFDLRRDFATPGSDGILSDLPILNFEKLSLGPLHPLSRFRGEFGGFIEPRFFGETTTDLAQGNGKNDPKPGGHIASLGLSSQTVPLNTRMVKQSELCQSGSTALTSEQLELLKQVTFVISDLSGDRLALTLGTTITLDTDAAGHGWLIDATPDQAEEYVPTSEAWAFEAAPGSGAEDKASGQWLGSRMKKPVKRASCPCCASRSR